MLDHSKNGRLSTIMNQYTAENKYKKDISRKTLYMVQNPKVTHQWPMTCQ